jgi:hypothetical protein
MKVNHIIPTKQGQIVRSLIPLDGIEPIETFILSDDPQLKSEDSLVQIFSITEFLRCQAIGTKPFGNLIKLKNLTFVAENLEEFVKSWNNQ